MGMGMLTGEIGCGKTLTRTVLQNRLPPRIFTVSLENCLLDFDAMLLEIISQIRGERVAYNTYPDRYSRLAAFKQVLMRHIVDAGRHLAIMLDEAQHLSPSDLEAVKALTNISSERRNFITVILIGQPELRANIRALPPVDQRVSLRYHLNPLALGETVEYLRKRLEAVGWQGPLPFNREAVEKLFATTRGIPREINRICKLAIEYAATHQRSIIDSNVIGVVTSDLNRHGGLPDPCILQ